MKKTPLIMVMLCVCFLSMSTTTQTEAKNPPPDLKDMIKIPAGEFIMGISEADVLKVCSVVNGMAKYLDNATPSRKVNLPEYYIDKYEVTNEQYKRFIDATGHKAPSNWDGNNFPKKLAKHPVTWVTWEDAGAYAKWAGKRLPTEAEWEKAARGTDGRLFPWGNKYKRKRANTDEARKGKTTKVGSFKKGVSPYGVHDMAGNVWEWTSDFYQAYPGSTCKDEFFGKERYVLRGGSFLDLKYDALTFVRSKFTPVTDDENVGFRCVY